MVNARIFAVLLGFASAKLLHAMSFADILNEDSGRGYQRRFNAQHSLDFRRYIQHDASGTIPLTLKSQAAVRRFLAPTKPATT